MYLTATPFQVAMYHTKVFAKRVLFLSVIAGLIYSGFQAGAYFSPEKVVAQEVEKIVEVRGRTAVMERIAKCESGGGHYDKNGQVIINATRDAGKYQINVPIHGKKATEMGLNLMVEKDNETMAYWLYDNFGTEPWIHSKSCWNK